MNTPSPIYAIGDIHGELAELTALISRCEQHARGRSTTFVFLGDYIDRGPDSAGVIRTLMGLQSRPRTRVVALKGNHEALALDAVDGAARRGQPFGCSKAASKHCAATTSDARAICRAVISNGCVRCR